MQEAGSDVFINGKAQIIDMLKFMPSAEKNVLIKNLKLKNPVLASELEIQSLTFSHVYRISDDEIVILLKYISAPIIGVAIKSTNLDFQKRILSIAPRSYAEEAYKTFTANLQNEKRDIDRAQAKVLSIMISLIKRKQIRI